MSDFLGALASRSVGTPAGLRPRVAGWFEPQADTRFMAEPALIEMESTVERPPAPRSTPSPETKRTPPEPQQAAPRAFTMPEQATPRSPEVAEPALLVARQTGDEAEPRTPTSRTESKPPARTQVEAATPQRVVHVVEVASERAIPAPIPQPRLRPSRESAPLRPVAVGRAELDARVLAEAEPSPSLSPPRDFDPPSEPTREQGSLVPRPAPAPPPREKPRAEAAVADAKATAAPTIHVTIGRIEVRAAAPAPVTQRPAPSRSSLQDYLRDRQEGKR